MLSTIIVPTPLSAKPSHLMLPFSSCIRLQPARLWNDPEDSLVNVIQFRLFFKLCLDNGDFASDYSNASGNGLSRPMDNMSPHLMVGSVVCRPLDFVQSSASIVFVTNMNIGGTSFTAQAVS